MNDIIMRISDTADLPMDLTFKKTLSAYEFLCPDELTKQANNEINEETNVESFEEQLPNSKQEDMKLLQNN